MLVVACIKQVPDTTQVKIDPVTNTLVRDGIPIIMNPFDTHALEEALRLKDKYGVRVAAVSMGPPNAEKTLREALALGVDEVVLLSDRAFGGADTLATSMVLSEAVRRLAEKEEDGLALVICGKQTIDGDTAQVGPGIAFRMNLVPLTLVDRIIDLDLNGRKIRVSRKLEGRHEIVEATLPAMLTVVREINQPRYPTLPKRLKSRNMKVEMWDNKAMNLDANQIGLKGSATAVRRIFSPVREKGEIVGNGMEDPSGSAKMLLERLLHKKLLAL